MSKAERTKAQIQATALNLFTSRGFDNVTVEEVANKAGVSHMTFYRYFPTKESVVLDDPYDPVIGEAVAAQPASLPALERVRSAFILILRHMDSSMDAETLTRVQIAVENTSLRARIWENNRTTEQVIVDALTATGVDLDTARAAAGAVLGATTAALIGWAESESRSTMAEALIRALGIFDSEPAVSRP